MTNYSFAEKARESLTPEVRTRVQEILTEQLEAWRFEWTEPGGPEDRSGVDLWIWLKNDLRRGIEVKNNKYGEVRLEYVSRRGEGVVGWTVNDRLKSDYVLNLWPNRYWLVDFPSLKAVAKAHRDRYAEQFGRRESSTTSGASDWKTDFIAVPEGVLLFDIFGRTVMGAPLSLSRTCPSCHQDHPVGVTCATGWAPF